MKVFVSAIILLCMADWIQAEQCEIKDDSKEPLKDKKWQDLKTPCYDSIRGHIQLELNASVTYLAMGAYFTRDKHYRPGVAAFFLASASEERQHAKELMNYILLRGQQVDGKAIPTLTDLKREWNNIEDALNDALDLETKVRDAFKNIIEICEQSTATEKNDYHAADLMTGRFLEEQHESIRQIAGHYATLKKMQSAYGNFAEIMFDNTLLQ